MIQFIHNYPIFCVVGALLGGIAIGILYVLRGLGDRFLP